MNPDDPFDTLSPNRESDVTDVRDAFRELDGVASEGAAESEARASGTKESVAQDAETDATVPPDPEPIAIAASDEMSFASLFDDRPLTDRHAVHIARIAAPVPPREKGTIDPAIASLFSSEDVTPPVDAIQVELDEIESAAQMIDAFCGDDIGTTGPGRPVLPSEGNPGAEVVVSAGVPPTDTLALVEDDTINEAIRSLADGGATAPDAPVPTIRELLEAFLNDAPDPRNERPADRHAASRRAITSDADSPGSGFG